MLPLLGALAGSTLAGSAGLTALTGAAIGSGLGTYAQTGDLGKGILAGIGSYGLGKFTSGMMGADAAAQAGTGATQATAGQTADQAVRALDAGLTAPPAVPPLPASGPMATTPSTPFFDRPAKIPGLDFKQLGSSAPSTIGQAVTTGLTAGTTGESIAFEPEPFKKKDIDFNTEEAAAFQRDVTMPGPDYRAGVDKEFDYFNRSGGLMSLQQGGAVKNDKQVVDDAIMAVKGQSPNPEMALGEYLNRFGEESLRSLVSAVRSGEVDVSAGRTEGTVRGAGDGMEDLVPANLEGKQDVLLSEGEFVVPADVVSGIGNGSTDAGADRLYDMLDRVREMRTGTAEQAPQISAEMAMPA
jgi:hypothetical protein